MRTGCPILVTLSLAGLVLLVGCSSKTTPPPVTEVVDDRQVIEHRVMPGETLSRIADNYYGDPSRAEAIARDNGITSPDRITEGSVLALRFGPDEWENALQRASALDAYNEGVDLMGQDRLAEAERQFQLALATAPDLAAAHYNLALVQLRRGKSDLAVDQLTTLVQERPTDTDFRFALGNALFQQAEFAEASRQFTLILEQNPNHSRAAFGLARSLQADDQVQAAMSAWLDYLELDSTSSWADAARRNYGKLRDGTQ